LQELERAMPASDGRRTSEHLLGIEQLLRFGGRGRFAAMSFGNCDTHFHDHRNEGRLRRASGDAYVGDGRGE